MKYFLIKYHLKNGSEEQWHQDIARFIAALDDDPAVRGKVSYRCMKRRGGSDYYHLAGAADDNAVQALQSQEFFKRYTEQTKLAGGGEVEVLPLEIAETKHRP
jgi:stalled ribosome alternative rescue factor ArfA